MWLAERQRGNVETAQQNMCISAGTGTSVINIPRCQLIRKFVSILICYSILFQFAAISIPYCFTVLLFAFGIFSLQWMSTLHCDAVSLNLVLCLSPTKAEIACVELTRVFFSLAE
jgi:hypothetical protein